MRHASYVLAAVAALALTGCETDQAGKAVSSVGNSVEDAAGGALKGAVSLVNVDLSNVLNDLSLDLKIDKANIPINAQIPISLAANVCGVSINILSVSGGGSPNCTATSTSPDLEQAVQQQLAANGSVGGGNQTTSGAGTSAPAPATATTPPPTDTSVVDTPAPGTTTTAPTSATSATSTTSTSTSTSSQ
jgi:predicted small secreted protein